MAQSENYAEMLNLINAPAFCVKNNIVCSINQAARQCGIADGDEVSQLLCTGQDEYAQFHGGCLYLTLSVNGIHSGASVSRVNDLDVFILDQGEQSELRSLALASQQLREPLSNIMNAAERLFSEESLKADPHLQEQAAHINKDLFRMLRILGNMSDAGKYTRQSVSQQETCEIASLFDEFLEKAGTLAREAGYDIAYTGIPQRVYCLVDKEKLERAVYNLLSNAMKHAPTGSTITVKLSKSNNKLYFTVQDNGTGISPELRGNVFSRYLRNAGAEDGRNGIGLGLLLVRTAAAAHNGTVLMEQPETGGTRVTMTLSLRQNSSTSVRSTIITVDYAGELDHGLIELSDVLPESSFKNIN